MRRLFRHVRTVIVAAFALLTVMSGLAAAHADVITANHLAHGERLLADGGWSSACDAAVERCVAQPVHSDTNSYGLHHHHHPDCQFSGLAVVSGATTHATPNGRAPFPAYAAVVKPATPSAADQPPKI